MGQLIPVVILETKPKEIMLENVFCLEVNNTASTSQPDFDIVFVHGLSSSASDAWTNNQEDLWPLWIRQFFPNCRVLLLNYPANAFFFSKTSRVSIKERAIGLSDIMPTIGLGVRPTIFICHSLGGIVVKEIIRCSMLGKCSFGLSLNTSGVVFLATPHSGSDIANFANAFGSKLTKELSNNSHYLIELKEWFSSYVKDTGLPISCYYETQPYKKVIIVSKQSANPECIGCSPIPVDENHSSICKPSGINHDVFVRIKRDITSIISKVNTMTKSIASIDQIISLPEITNQMYFDILHFLNNFFYAECGGEYASIISNPSGGMHPCCIIVTSVQSIKDRVYPLAERWPDRFKIHDGYLGELTCEKSNKKESPHSDIVISYKKESFSFEIASIISQLFNPIIEVSICMLIDNDNEYNAITALHKIHMYVREWCENEINHLLNKTKKQPSKKYKKLTLEFNNIVKKQDELDIKKSYINIIDESVNMCFMKNNFNIKINNIEKINKSDDVKPRIRCKIRYIDYRKDMVVFEFKKSNIKSNKFNIWKNNNKKFIVKKGQYKPEKISIGSYCESPIFKDKKLEIRDVGSTAIIPYLNRISEISSVMVVSGDDPQAGDSGSPIINKIGSIIGMIIGRTTHTKEKNILAVAITNDDIKSIEGKTDLLSENT